MPIMMPDGTDRPLPEREATSDEAYELGKTAGFDEGWNDAVQCITHWLREQLEAEPKYKWAEKHIDSMWTSFNKPQYVEVTRPEQGL